MIVPILNSFEKAEVRRQKYFLIMVRLAHKNPRSKKLSIVYSPSYKLVLWAASALGNLFITYLYTQQYQSMTTTISNTYECVWQIKGAEQYKVTKCRKIINTHRGKEIRRVINGRSVGYWISGKFIPLSTINKYVEKIPVDILPF